MKEVIEDRYIESDGKIVDREKNEILLFRSTIINRLNRQDRLLRVRTKRIDAMIDVLNHEIETADNEDLKQALIRISNIEVEL